MNNTLTLLPLLSPAIEGKWLDMGDHRVRYALTSQQTGSYLLVEVEADLGANVPPHIHQREDETLYVLEGRFVIEVGDRKLELGPGDSAIAPRDIAHTWRCISPEGGRKLVIISPGDNFEHFARAVADQNIVAGDPASMPLLLALAQEHGLTMLPPR